MIEEKEELELKKQNKNEMEEDSAGLLPIKETDMKYYVYVSTPIALVG